MADSLLFDGVDDKIDITLGNLVIIPGTFTIAFAVKQTADDSTVKYLIHIGVAGSEYAFYHDTTGRLAAQIGGGLVVAPTATFRHTTAWTIAGYSHAAGTNAPRFHTYDFDTSTWVHENGGSTMVDGVISTVAARIGIHSGGTGAWNGNVLLAGVWNKVLSDSDWETLDNNLQAWYDLAPRELWRLDRTSDLRSIARHGQSYETSRTGTTLDTGDVPAGWSDALVTVAPTPLPGARLSKFPKPKLRTA